jgi:hypothetical protein
MADISWISPEDHGRRSGPPDIQIGVGYWCTARMEKDAEDWSMNVDVSPGAGCYLVRFMTDSAPNELLVPGAKFKVKEGSHVVAHGVVR